MRVRIPTREQDATAGQREAWHPLEHHVESTLMLRSRLGTRSGRVEQTRAAGN
jgi:hypothetical protein